MFRVMETEKGNRLALNILLIILLYGFSGGSCLTNEGWALIAFRRKIFSDPHSVLVKWSEGDDSPCRWPGITCFDGRVTSLELTDLYLGGTIAPELADLTFLIKLNLGGNKFSGSIPGNLWTLKTLQRLDLSSNQILGSIPPEIENLVNLQTLNLANNQFGGVVPKEIEKLFQLRHLRLNNNRFTGFIPGGCLFQEHVPCGLCNLKQLQTLDLSYNYLEGEVPSCILHHPSRSFEGNCLYAAVGRLVQRNDVKCGSSHRLLRTNSRANETTLHPQADQKTRNLHQQKHVSKKAHHRSPFLFGLLYALPVIVATALVILVIAVFFYKRKAAAVSPWKAGMSGHLQKVFVTDVPALSWSQLQSACEDFSNIIGSSPDSVVFKGTLSNGTEVAVTSIRISAASWTASSEIFFRRKVEALARMKHTHLVNLLGYCAEEDPFARMLLFEYAPNGTLFEHLHNDDSEHLDWPARMRIVMGAAYGLEYMHHDLVPPASHSNFDSNAIYLTEDYAAKLADFGISKIAVLKSDRRKSFSNAIGYDDLEGSDRHAPDFESNIFSFGLFLLEIITGRLPYSEKEGSLLEWALEFLSSPESVGYMVDASLKGFDLNQLMVICDVVRLCIQSDPSKRPTMKAITSLLAKGLNMSPDFARPRSSPLLWAELEILSPVA